MSDRAIRSVAVLGGGITGLSAALAFARALPQVQVSLIRTPADPNTLADRLPGTLPSIARFHDAIGLPEAELLRSGAATRRLGTRFEHWSADDARWIHVHGDYGLPAGIVPFHQLWAQARRLGQGRAYHAYSAGAVIADAGKFVLPDGDPRSPLSTFDYALRLSREQYAALLAALAGSAGVAMSDGTLAQAERRADGGVAALLLADGRRIEADLFLDCTGTSAALLSKLADSFEDWSGYLPCHRLLLSTGPATRADSCDTVEALPDGWQSSTPLPDRTLQVRASDTAEGDAITIRPGRRPNPWLHNVLAIGDAAIAIDPLVSANLHLAHSAILRALALLPGRDCAPVELAEYNRLTALEAARVRDFTALHYLRSGRSDGAFWQAAARLPVPDSLAHTLQQFDTRGRLPFHEEETFEKDSWLAALCGMGMLPRATDPVALAAPLEINLPTLEQFADDLAAMAARLP